MAFHERCINATILLQHISGKALHRRKTGFCRLSCGSGEVPIAETSTSNVECGPSLRQAFRCGPGEAAAFARLWRVERWTFVFYRICHPSVAFVLPKMRPVVSFLQHSGRRRSRRPTPQDGYHPDSTPDFSNVSAVARVVRYQGVPSDSIRSLMRFNTATGQRGNTTDCNPPAAAPRPSARKARVGTPRGPEET